MKEATFVRLDPAVKRDVARIAEADGRTLSALISKIVSDWLAAQKPVKVRKSA